MRCRPPLGVPGAHQRAAVASHKREDVPRGDEILRALAASIATEMVRARSAAEMPVVTPSLASIEMVKAVCIDSLLLRLIGVRPR